MTPHPNESASDRGVAAAKPIRSGGRERQECILGGIQDTGARTRQPQAFLSPRIAVEVTPRRARFRLSRLHDVVAKRTAPVLTSGGRGRNIRCRLVVDVRGGLLVRDRYER